MARNISFFNLRTAAKIKNGRDTKVAVDANGSECLRLKNNEMHTINRAIKRDVSVSMTWEINS